MGKAIAGAVTVAIVAAILFYFWAGQNRFAQDQMQQQITALNNQIIQLREENTQLKGQLASVQSEEQNLAAQNDELRKAIGTVKATGKLPPNLPYPPK
jgi:cell division protein FtsB